MSRDEAIERFARAMHNPLVEYWTDTVARVTPMIDGFIALGMLSVAPAADPNFCRSCKKVFVQGSTCSRGGCPMGGDF
jgi:hypothetical protein